MNLADASNEFNLRHYVWSKAEWEKEINESFPHLRLFKTGPGWTLYQFMQKLNKEEQLVFAMGRLKRRYRASKWREHLSEEEESMCRKFDAFHDVRHQFQAFKQHRSDLKASDARIVFDAACASDARVLCNTDSTDPDLLAAELEDFLNSFPQSFEEQVKARKLSGEKIKLVSKKRLQKILTEKVKDIFGNQYEECRVDEGHWTAFDIKCGDWMLQTQFNFGASLDTSKACLDIGITFVLRKELRITQCQKSCVLSPTCAWALAGLVRLNGNIFARRTSNVLVTKPSNIVGVFLRLLQDC